MNTVFQQTDRRIKKKKSTYTSQIEQIEKWADGWMEEWMATQVEKWKEEQTDS